MAREEYRRCVLSLGINSPPLPDHPRTLFQDYRRGLLRIRDQLSALHFAGDFVFWDQDYPQGAPRHEEARFAFKPFCFEEARRRGYQLALWMDSCVVINDGTWLDHLFDVIRDQGYMFVSESHSVGMFCRDEALPALGITREESFRLPSAWGCVIGLNLTDERSLRFLESWKQLAAEGTSFRGPKWSGVRGAPRTASLDPRVRGHRSQGAMSVVALRLEMNRWLSKRDFEKMFVADRKFVRTFDE
jgi:hypothetical protein